MQDLSTIAKTYGVDEAALRSLASFLMSNITKNDELRAAFLKNPDAILKIGVEKWLEASTKYLNKLLDPNSSEYKKVSEEVYNTLRA